MATVFRGPLKLLVMAVAVLVIAIAVLGATCAWVYKSLAQLADALNQCRETVEVYRSVLELGYSTVLEKGRAITVSPLDNVALSYNVTYPGYLAIAYTATDGIYLEVCSSIQAPCVWYPTKKVGPYTCTFNEQTQAIECRGLAIPEVVPAPQGSTIVPVAPGLITIRFFNPSSKSVVVTVDVTYVY